MDCLNGRLCGTHVERKGDQLVFDARRFREDRGSPEVFLNLLKRRVESKSFEGRRRITFFNSSAETITGFKAAEAVGQKCFDIFRSDICERECPLDRSLASGKPELRPLVRIISKSGTEVPVSMSTSLLKDHAGSIVGGVRIFRDLSELEKLRRELAGTYTSEDAVESTVGARTGSSVEV